MLFNNTIKLFLPPFAYLVIHLGDEILTPVCRRTAHYAWSASVPFTA